MIVEVLRDGAVGGYCCAVVGRRREKEVKVGRSMYAHVGDEEEEEENARHGFFPLPSRTATSAKFN